MTEDKTRACLFLQPVTIQQGRLKPPHTCCLRDGQAPASCRSPVSQRDTGIPSPRSSLQVHDSQLFLAAAQIRAMHTLPPQYGAQDPSLVRVYAQMAQNCSGFVGSKTKISPRGSISSLSWVGDIPYLVQDWAALCCPKDSHHTFLVGPVLHQTSASAADGVWFFSSPKGQSSREKVCCQKQQDTTSGRHGW